MAEPTPEPFGPHSDAWWDGLGDCGFATRLVISALCCATKSTAPGAPGVDAEAEIRSAAAYLQRTGRQFGPPDA